MTPPFDIPIEFDKLEGFTPVIRPLADGLRASTVAECASCAIIEYVNPSDERIFSGFNPGVGTLGHLLHQAWAWQEFGYEQHEIEPAIPWKHGVSHDDVVVHAGDWAGMYEVKTHSDPKPKAPSAANHRQSQFRMRLRELAGLPQPGPMRLVMIGKAGNEGGWVRGPWTVELDDERRNEIDETLASIDRILARVGSLDLHNDAELKSLANGCSTCFPKPVVQPVRGLDGLLGRYVSVDREFAQIDAQRKKYADAKKDLAKDRDELRDEIKKLVPPGVVVDGMAATATLSKTGSLTIKPHAPAEATNAA